MCKEKRARCPLVKGLCLFLFSIFSAGATTHYVVPDNPAAASPFSTWSSAAATIQDAIDAADPGDLILVTNGVYQTGGRSATVSVNHGLLVNRVAIDKAVTVQSVNGPLATIIQGYQVPGQTNGGGAIRCVFLTNNAALIGFTLTQGATLTNGISFDRSGGGAYCLSGAVISNCTLVGNTAATSGGATMGGLLYNCNLSFNRATNGGGANSSTLFNCYVISNTAVLNGGGAYASFLDNCVVATNTAFHNGGGTDFSSLTNCSLIANIASNGGGGADSGTLTNCILRGNSAPNGGGANSATLFHCLLTNNLAAGGGGGISCTLSDCTLTGNSASSGGGAYQGKLTNCTIIANSAASGGGSYNAFLKNCNVVSNTASGSGGGVSGGSAIGCALLGNSASARGGGADSVGMTNCTVIGNLAATGGGVQGGTARNCILLRNHANTGGGINEGWLYNCTVTQNSASSDSGGVNGSLVINSIVYFNSAPIGANYNPGAGAWLNSCTTPPQSDLSGNLTTDDPMLTSDFHLAPNSPCRGAGDHASATGTDIDGEPWLNPPSMGCDEYYSATATGPLTVGIQAAYTNASAYFVLNFFAEIGGVASSNVWDFGDGTIISNRLSVAHSWNAPGDYPVTVTAYNNSNPSGIYATTMVHVVVQPIHYVALSSTNPVPPYSTWNSAATNIQDALNAANVCGALVLVSNGVYNTGGRVMNGALTNRVAMGLPVVVQSVNGPSMTTIVGATDGYNAVRCAYLADEGALIGFTVTNGTTLAIGDQDLEQSGGGVFCAGASAVVSNCVIIGNASTVYGGGVYSGSVKNSIIQKNTTGGYGGGSYYTLINGSTLTDNFATAAGGGAAYATMNDCNVARNVTPGSGGGAYYGSMGHCIVAGNFATNSGGGTFYTTVNDSLLSNNVAYIGGGAWNGLLTNCIVKANMAASGGGIAWATLANCVVSSNSASLNGGGASIGTLINCKVIGNSAAQYGGGYDAGGYGSLTEAYDLLNCTLVGNSARYGGGGAEHAVLVNCTVVNNSTTNGYGGGIDQSAAYNCIVYYNNLSVPFNTNANFTETWLSYCCMLPAKTNGPGNFTNAPAFINLNSGNLRLQTNSPCIDSGTNFSFVVGVDLDGRPRFVGSHPDIGAYEFQPGVSGEFIGWLENYGLPTDGSIDYADADLDSLNNWQEWRAGTDPTNAASVLQVRSVMATNNPSGMTVTWQSVTGVVYYVQRSTNLGAQFPFVTVGSNIAGQAGTTGFTDTNAVLSGQLFYRIGVQP